MKQRNLFRHEQTKRMMIPRCTAYIFDNCSLIRGCWFAAIFLLTLLPSAVVYGQQQRSDIDSIFDWSTASTPGCVCAVSQKGKIIVNKAYGSADLERKVPLTVHSVLDAGSVRKQFVAAAILLLVQEGKLSLTDDVRNYIKELPDYGHTVTIDHLLTHTSGIRDWQPLLNVAGGDPDARTMILRQRGLNFAPGEEWSYSNSGYVLLPEIVRVVSGLPFSAFVQQKIFQPLGMQFTRYVDDMNDVIKNRALAYSKDKDRWKLDMYTGNERGGAGALFTCPGDLLIWNDALTHHRLGRFVSEKLTEPAKLNNGRRLYYTRGLSVEPYRGHPLIAHSGGVAGYRAWVGRLPEQQLSIAVMCNSDAVSATSIAGKIMEKFVLGRSANSMEDGPPPVVPAGLLPEVSRKAGLFFNKETGAFIRLVMDRERLRIAGGPGLLTITKDSFRRWGAFVEYMSQDKFTLRFLSPDEFELKSMEGKVTRYTRAATYAPSPADLQSFAGRYKSEELMAEFDISVDQQLTARVNNRPGPPFPLTPVHPDYFQFAGVTLHFIRDKTGKVIALDYSNPLIRDVRLTRTGGMAASSSEATKVAR